jgi:hypothetical protein
MSSDDDDEQLGSEEDAVDDQDADEEEEVKAKQKQQGGRRKLPEPLQKLSKAPLPSFPDGYEKPELAGPMPIVSRNARDLNLGKNHFAAWSVKGAVRELIQNTFDGADEVAERLYSNQPDQPVQPVQFLPVRTVKGSRIIDIVTAPIFAKRYCVAQLIWTPDKLSDDDDRGQLMLVNYGVALQDG